MKNIINSTKILTYAEVGCAYALIYCELSLSLKFLFLNCFAMVLCNGKNDCNSCNTEIKSVLNSEIPVF